MRPLFDDGKGNPSAVTRDYVFDLDETGGGAAAHRVRRQDHDLSQARRARLAQAEAVFPQMGGDWTADAPLPGGDMPNADFEAFVTDLRRGLSLDAACRWCTTMPGSTAPARSIVVAGAERLADLGRHFGGLLYEREVRYLVAKEWARDGRGHPLSAHQALPAPEPRTRRPPSPSGSRHERFATAA